MNKKFVLLGMCVMMLLGMCGLCYATTYSHYVDTTSSTVWENKITTWTPTGTDLVLVVDCQIRVKSSLFTDKACIRDVIPDSIAMRGSRFEEARGRVWGDKDGAVYTSWTSLNDPEGSEEQTSKYDNLYTFSVEIRETSD